MPRLFTGLEVPDDIRRDLSMLRGGLPGARWVEPSDYHITLRFIGDIGGRQAAEIDALLAELEGDGPQISLSRLDIFGGDKPRAIIAAIDPNRRLQEIQNEQERLLRRYGLMSDTRKYTPHITLAWLKSSSIRDVADYLASRGGFPSRHFQPNRFVMYSAREQTGGGPYVVEAAYPFRSCDEDIWTNEEETALG